MLGKPFKPRIPRRDKIIQSTDLDALSFKYSAQCKGYLNDQFVDALVKQSREESAKEARVFDNAKLPLINIGTYIRTRSIDEICYQFVESYINEPCQIISLGAGSDTRPFKMLENYLSKQDFIYHEIDFEASTSRKARAIAANKPISEVIGLFNDTCNPQNELHTSRYHLHAQDLRNIDSNTTPSFKGMEQDIPTLIVSECCICYMEPGAASNLLTWISKYFTAQLGLVIYEPMTLNDSFGRVMTQNLALRGICLPTVENYPTLESQGQRLKDLGLDHVQVDDMYHVLNNWVQQEENTRIRSLEFLDEWEELELLLKHYCLVWGSRYAIPTWAHLTIS